MRILAAGILVLAFASSASSQTPARTSSQAARQAPRENANGPWFGVHLPPKSGAEPAVIVGDRQTRPVTLLVGEPRVPEFAGAEIKKTVEKIVSFSKESRASKEIGTGQLWGRISGFPSSAKTIEWAAEEFRKAGIGNVRLQPIQQDSRASFWVPLEWEVKLIGDPSFGPNSTDIVLTSAMPLSPSDIANGMLTAPLVFVGNGDSSLLDHLDVKGKIAVQLTIPQGHMVFERGAVTGHAKELFKRGAAAVLNLVRLPGNELSNDFSNCGGPCFNLGGRDGLFLESILEKAAQKGLSDKVRAQLKLKSETRTGLTAQNAVAVVQGASSEVIVIDAHADAWFDGAGDNADGLAVMLALARHFAKFENKPARTLVFIASAGHHSPGINGPRNFVADNADYVKKAELVINIEHVAQRNFSPGRETYEDGYRQTVADSGEAPIAFGITNRSPFLDALAEKGVVRFGVNLVSERSAMQSGETGGFADIKNTKVTVMQAAPLYHTTGEVFEVISTPGLERMARFLAYFVKEAAAAPHDQLNP